LGSARRGKLVKDPEKGELLAFVKPTKKIGDMTPEEGLEFARSLILLMRARAQQQQDATEGPSPPPETPPG
jgi:hypothetical protein